MKFANFYVFVLRAEEAYQFPAKFGPRKARFPLKPYVAKRSVFHCFVNIQAELMIWTTIEYVTFRYDTVEVENGLNSFNPIYRLP